MPFAIFDISNTGLNLVVTLFILMLVVVWMALIVYTYLDARRRVSDPFLVACATIAALIPYIGTAVYAILRPPEFLEDAHERELEIRAAELRVRQLTELSCPNCEYPVEKNYLRCPNCQHRLKDPCPTCSKPVDPRWAVCPYCESELEQRQRRRAPEKRRSEERRPAEERKSRPAEERKNRPAERKSRSEERERRPAERKSRSEEPAPTRAQEPRKPASAPPPGKEPATRAADKEAPSDSKPQKGSKSREPDPDPRQA